MEKKTQHKNVELKLAIGFEDKIISGPESAVKKQTKNYVLISPGWLKKSEIATKLMKKIKNTKRIFR